MPIQKLDDKTISAFRVPNGTRTELWDKATPGLCLRVSATGDTQRKVWVWRYRTLDGRQPRLRLGEYGETRGLKWARLRVGVLKAEVEGGKDPADEKRKAKAAAKAQTIRTFNDLADAYLQACERGEWKPKGKQKRARTLADETGSLKRHIRPALGERRVETITRAEIRNFLRGMIDKGIGAQTNKAHAVIRQCFAFAISEDRVPFNPAIGFAKLATETPRARVLTDKELQAMWGPLKDPTGLTLPLKDGETKPRPLYVGRPMRIAIQLSAILLQRRGEVAGMRASELDLTQSTWLIPGERMKNGFPHLVPLPPYAVELIKEAMALATARRPNDPSGAPVLPNDWPIFPAQGDVDKSIRPDSLTHATVHIAAALGIKDVTPHDLRRTGSTMMTSERLGISPFIRSKVLGHRGDTGGGAAVSVAHYDANTYAAEKRRALTAWEELLLHISEKTPD
jgi:integrase